MSAEPTLMDEAARAGWLYYVAGMTQDQIATELGVSRQRAQRLVSKAMAEGLVIALEATLKESVSPTLRDDLERRLLAALPSQPPVEALRLVEGLDLQALVAAAQALDAEARALRGGAPAASRLASSLRF